MGQEPPTERGPEGEWGGGCVARVWRTLPGLVPEKEGGEKKGLWSGTWNGGQGVP